MSPPPASLLSQAGTRQFFRAFALTTLLARDVRALLPSPRTKRRRSCRARSKSRERAAAERGRGAGFAGCTGEPGPAGLQLLRFRTKPQQPHFARLGQDKALRSFIRDFFQNICLLLTYNSVFISKNKTEDAQAINPTQLKDTALFNYFTTTKEQFLKSFN